MALLGMGRPEEARKDFGALERAGDSLADPYLVLLGRVGRAASGDGDPLALLKLAAASGAPADDILRDEALLLLQDRRHDEALSILGDLVGRSPGDVEARRLLAQLYGETGDLVQAVAEAREALRLRPYDRDLRMLLAGLWVSRKDAWEALQVLGAGLELAPEDPGLRYGIAMILLQSRRWDMALENLDVILARDPGNAAVALARVRALLGAGRKEEARTALEGIVARNPDIAEARSLLDGLNASQGDPAK